MTARGRFPLRPGKPLVFRRPNGAWGYSCVCVGAVRVGGCLSSDRHNCESWAEAVRQAGDHIRHGHLTPAQVEARELERLFALPAFGEVAR